VDEKRKRWIKRSLVTSVLGRNRWMAWD